MKKQIFAKRFLALSAATVMLFISSFTIRILPARADTAEDEHFFQALTEMVNSQDSSAYFDTIELTIGSNIMKVDGISRQINAVPIMQGGQIMLPLQPIAEAAGASTGYDEASASALIISNSGNIISSPVGSSSMTINGETSTTEEATAILGGQVYMPVGAVSKALDMEMSLEQSTATVTLSAPYQTCRVLAWGSLADIQGLAPSAVLQSSSGMCVLQFDTQSQARDAVELLTARGVEAGPDLYIPLIKDQLEESMISVQGSHYSWGAENCHFDQFIALNGSRFTSSGVVAVIDTGVDFGHPFLQGRVLPGYDFVDGDNLPYDGHSHGTHVAGTVIDCAGSAPVSILPVRVMDNRGSGFDSVITAGIQYAADHGADVLNLSLGGPHSSIQDRMIAYAVSKGCLVAIAAGNDGWPTSLRCPAHLKTPGTVIVSAGNQNHVIADFSNFGDNVDVMAPGVSIRASIPGGGYASMNGTSMATPHVAAAAVLLDIVWGKTLDPASLEKQLQTATSKGVWTNQYMGYGFLDMSKAALPGGTTPPAPDPKPNPTPAPDPKPTPAPDPTPAPKPDPKPEPKPAPLPDPPKKEGMNLSLGEPVLTPSYYTRNADGELVPRYKKVELSLGCAYSGPAPTMICLSVKSKNSDWKIVKRSFLYPGKEHGDYRNDINPFRFSDTYDVSGEPGEKVYYKFLVGVEDTKGGKNFRLVSTPYESEVGSYTIPKK